MCLVRIVKSKRLKQPRSQAHSSFSILKVWDGPGNKATAKKVYDYVFDFDDLLPGSSQYRLLPCHSQIPREDQRKVFEPVPQGVTKVRLHEIIKKQYDFYFLINILGDFVYQYC